MEPTIHLEKPPAALSPFANWACAHSFYDAVFQWLVQRIFGLSEPSVLLIIGPTGVGKSTLINQFIRQLALRMAGLMQADPSRLHAVYAEAVYLPSRGVDWEGLFTSLLRDANDILIDRKVAKVWPPDRPGLRGLAAAVNAMLLHRAPAACIIDEGGSLVESDSVESLNRVLDYLKSLGNRSRTHIVIFGDYRLARMVHFNGQLNRRCHIMHFSNYPEGYRDQFELVVGTFEARLHAQKVQANLKVETDLLFAGTCGCVGLLKRWVENAWLMVAEADGKIDRAVLETTQFPVGSVTKWRSEITAGHDAVRAFFDGPKRSTGNQPTGRPV